VESANYPIRNINLVEREDGTVELVATLLGTTADPHELDAVIAYLTQSPLVQHASWSLRTAD
jgi:putative Mg2+ transporter-C (MgtC) family protein